MGDGAVQNFCRGQKSRRSVNRRLSFVERKLRIFLVALQVGVVEGFDGSNVFPVPIVQKGLHVHAHVLRVRDDFTAKVVLFFAVFHQQIFHSLGGEDVDTHGGDVRHFFRFFRVQT